MTDNLNLFLCKTCGKVLVRQFVRIKDTGFKDFWFCEDGCGLWFEKQLSNCVLLDGPLRVTVTELERRVTKAQLVQFIIEATIAALLAFSLILAILVPLSDVTMRAFAKGNVLV